MKARSLELRNLPGNPDQKAMDTISNTIIKIKNASNAGHESVALPYSALRLSILEVLKKEGFIKGFKERMVDGKKALVAELIFEEARLETGRRAPKIKGVERLSKPSKRIYKKSSEIRPVKNGYGTLILSTSLGVMSGYEAKKSGLGGEALFAIW